MSSKDKTEKRACGCIYVGSVLIFTCPSCRRANRQED